MPEIGESPAIEVVGLKKSYKSGFFKKPFEALRGVTLRVNRGEIFGLLGPNGAGKTTLIKILLGIVRKSSGTANLLGLAAGDRRSRLRVGYLPENLRISGHHTAVSAMNYYGRLSRLSSRQIELHRDRLLEMVGLSGRTKESVKRFSKGMLQRLGLAQALLHDPELLILDEPTDGLDPLGRSQIRQLLRLLKDQGKTVFLNSHILQEVEVVCDRVAIMDRGILKGVGTLEEIAPKQQTGIELEMSVVALEADIRIALPNATSLKCETTPNGPLHVTLRLHDQAGVDDCVDRLRQRKISIHSLAPKRVTLEDAFLNLMDDKPEEIIPVASLVPEAN